MIADPSPHATWGYRDERVLVNKPLWQQRLQGPPAVSYLGACCLQNNSH